MERAVCEQCGARQLTDWEPGDFCSSCGAAVRREVRCAWCTEWIPAGRFCRSCGCEIVSDPLYGAARMLKSAGVDRFSIAGKLRELDPEQVQNLSRIYESQLAIVLRRCDEARLCEAYLLQGIHSRRIEEELIRLLPMEKDALHALASGPAGPFESRPELLPEIAGGSPIQVTRMLAAIALLREGCTKRDLVAAASAALHAQDAELALEAALGLAHWRVRGLHRQFLFGRQYDGGVGIDAGRLVEIARSVNSHSPLHPWAAAAFTLARFSDGTLPATETAAEEEAEEWEIFRDSLRGGLTSSDPDLRFTCALALGDEDILAGELDAEDEQRRAVARHYLARHKSPAVRHCLTEGSREVCTEVLDDLWPPLPKELVEPVLRAVERGDADMRLKGAHLLQPSLDEKTVQRLVKIACREADTRIFEILLGAESLPESKTVIRTIIREGLFQTFIEKLSNHIDFSDEAVARLANPKEPQLLESMIRLADQRVAGCF